MNFQIAVLGLLSWKPMTGYDLKKIIRDSSFMYWTANNNQIYKTLVDLLNEGYVSHKVQHKDGAPSKKIYSITQIGQETLRNYIRSSQPEQPEVKKNFLIQLAWADMLTDDELSGLLNQYEEEIKALLIMEQEKLRRDTDRPHRNDREVLLWDLIGDNIIIGYEAELKWIKKARELLITQKK